MGGAQGTWQVSMRLSRGLAAKRKSEMVAANWDKDEEYRDNMRDLAMCDKTG